MNQARLSSSFLTLLFCFSAGSAQDSPLEWHRFLREAFIARREVASDLREFIDRSGDHSFDSLLHYSERKRIALRMQKVAWQAWDDGNYTHAVRIYRQSAEQLLQEGARSEAAFCFYYIAEIHAEQEDFSESLAWLERAAQASGSRERPYLEALLQQSRGYCFWFTDHLQASVHAFSMALEHWQRLHFQAGVVATWNNLASLYEELGLWERARSCYQKALQQVDLSLDPEMLFYLHANYALFSHQRSHTTQALHHLNQARQLKAVSPEEFLILESQILGAKSRVHDLLSLRSELPSLRIEKALVLGRFFEKREKDTRAYHYFDQAYQESKESGLRYFTRKTALHLGHWLETHHRYREAADLYFEVYRGEENIRVPELAFPYSRAVSPIFDGWIRCLVRLGRTHEAWLAIQDLLEMRRIKAERFKQVAPQIRYVRNELDQLVVVGKLEGQSPVPISLEALPSAEKSLLFKLPAALLRRFSIVEMWPDQEKVYVWIRQASGRTFREVTFPGKVDEAIRNVVDRLYLAGNSLSPPPPTSKLRELYKGLFRPLEELLDSRTVLFIAHKELQNLPLEMLQNEQGQYLLQFYDFSYLPSSYQLLQASSPTRSAPVMVSLDSSPPLTEAGREEVFFKTLFPNIQVVKELADLPRTARWVHIASHFRMDDRFWLVSGLEKDAEKLNILSLLNTPLSCSLLSLGVCEAGNGYSSGSPYWLGFTELLLTQKVEALIVSRWRMDERSSGIYRRFYALCRRGLSMDEALSQARRHFLVKALRRRNSKVSAGHPFFWAGITYVGLPGKKLYEVSERHTRSFFPLGVSLCLVGLSAALVLAHVCHFLTLPG